MISIQHQIQLQPQLVSTIIPVYNRPEMVRRAVASVLAQTYRPIEILLVDDGSCDDSQAVARRTWGDCPWPMRLLQAGGRG